MGRGMIVRATRGYSELRTTRVKGTHTLPSTRDSLRFDKR